MSSTIIRLGVIGYRNSAKNFHLPFIAAVPSIKVHAIVQRTPRSPDAKPGDHCTIDYPEAKHFSDVDAFFDDPEIDLVLVCTNAMHYEYAKRALQSGKHVVVEKPFTATSAEADELVHLAKETKKLVTVFQNRRFDGDFLTVQKLIRDGVFGDVLEFESHYDWDDPGWPSQDEGITKYIPGQGMLYGLGAHTVDQALLLFGRPQSVFAIFRAHRDGSRGSAIDDWHTVILQYPGEMNQGVVVTIKSSQISPLTKQLRFFVRGRKGTYIKHYHDIQEEQIFAGKLTPLDANFGLENPERYGELTTATLYNPSYQVEDVSGRQPRYVGRIPTVQGNWKQFYEEVVTSIHAGEDFIKRVSHARDVIRLFELARESAQTGRTVLWH